MDFEADEGAHLNTSVWTLVGVSGLFLCLRIWCKLARARSLWWDDALLTVSWTFLLVSAVLVTLTVKRGFGNHVYAIAPEALSDITYIGLWSGTFSILATVVSKTSFTVTLMRVMEGNWKILLWAILVTMNIAMSLNALLAWLQCAPIEKGWHYKISGRCWPPEVYAHFGIFAAGYSAAMDFVLASLPWKIVWNLQMKMQEKIGVALALSLGIFAGITAIVKTVEILALARGDFTYDGVTLIIWGTAETAVTVIATSIPVLRSLILGFKERATRTVSTDEWTDKKTRTGQTSATVTANRSRFGRNGPGDAVNGRDDGSDRYILFSQSDGRIVQTREFAIEYEDRTDVHSPEYEMSRL